MIVATAFAGGLPPDEAVEMLTMIRDGYTSHQQRIKTVVAEGTRTIESTVRDESGNSKEVIKEVYAVRWKQLGGRIRYEERLTESNRPGLETEEARKLLGANIHVVLPDSYFIHYESSGVTDRYDRERWDSDRVGIQVYTRIGTAGEFADPGRFVAWLLEKQDDDEKVRTEWEVSRQEKDGRLTITVKCIQSFGGSETEREMSVDPARGFLPLEGRIAQRRHSGPEARVGKVIQTIEPISFDENVWFIKRAVKKEFSVPSPAPFEMLDTLEFERISVNDDRHSIRGDHFSLHALPLAKGALVVDQRASQGYVTGQAIFQYNQLGITEQRLSRFVEKLSEATGQSYETEKVCQVGQPDFFLWDPANRLFLTDEALCGVFALWSVVLAKGQKESFGDVARRFSEIRPHGLSLDEVQQAAQTGGLGGEAIKSQRDALAKHLKQGGAAILHLAPHHFTAAVRLSDEGVYLADYPSVKATSWADLEKQWSGNALFIAATPGTGRALRSFGPGTFALASMGGLLLVMGAWLIGRRRAKNRG